MLKDDIVSIIFEMLNQPLDSDSSLGNNSAISYATFRNYITKLAEILAKYPPDQVKDTKIKAKPKVKEVVVAHGMALGGQVIKRFKGVAAAKEWITQGYYAYGGTVRAHFASMMMQLDAGKRKLDYDLT